MHSLNNEMELLALGTIVFHQLHYSLFQQALLLRVRVLRGWGAVVQREEGPHPGSGAVFAREFKVGGPPSYAVVAGLLAAYP